MIKPSRSALGSWLALAVGLLAGASLVWFVGPLLAVSGWRPLESAPARALLIGVTLLLPFGVALTLRLRAWRRAQRVAQQPDALDSIIDQALLRLRARAAITTTGWRGLWARWQQFMGPDPLLALPWVLVIGMPGAGVRRALLLQGYDLPALPERAPEPPCTWCITPTAVLIVVAGTVLADDPASWQRLVLRLAQARPLQPVSALLLLIPASEHAGQVLADLPGPFAVARARLAELEQFTGMAPPLQLAVSGCERLNGFPGIEVQQRLRAVMVGLPLSWTQPGPAALLGRDPTELRRLIDGLVLASLAQPRYAAGYLQRQRWRVRGGYAATVLAAAGLAAGWAVSREQNLRLIERQQLELATLQSALDAAQPALAEGNLAPVLSALDRLQDVVRFANDANWTARLGLFQGDKLQAFAEAARSRLLREELAPVLLQRHEALLRTQLADPRPDTGRVYATLQLYLGLLERAPFGKAGATEMAAGFSEGPFPLNNELQSSLRGLLIGLLQSGGIPNAPADEALVAQARQWLAAQPMAELLYIQLQRRHLAAGQAQLTVAALVGGADAALFSRPSGRPLTEGVPTLYTLDGIGEFVRNAFTDEVLAEIRQVLGQAPVARAAAYATNPPVIEAALQRYQQDYIAAWQALLFDIRLAPVPDSAAAERLAARLLAADSPLATLMRNAAVQTAPGKQLSELADGKPQMLVDQRFAALVRLVSGQPPPLDAVLALMAERLRQPAAGDASAPGLKASASSLPEPLRGMLSHLAGQADNTAGTAASNAITTPTTTPSVAGAEFGTLQRQCRRSAANRYPLVAQAKAEVPLADFGALFGEGTGFDAYFQRWLAPLVDTSTQPWAWRAGTEAQRPVPTAALASFEQAARLREVFFRRDGRQLSLSITLSVGALDSSIPAVEVRVNSQPTLLRVGQGSLVIDWPGKPAMQRISLGAAGGKGPELSFEGPWALPRLLDALTLQPSRAPDRYFAKRPIGGRPAELTVTMGSALGLGKAQLRQFECPASNDAEDAGPKTVPPQQAVRALENAAPQDIRKR